jgi:hypothetical protein
MKLTFTEIAEVAHEVNRAYCESLGDFSQVPWKDAPNWQKVSAIQGVIEYVVTPDLKPADLHKAWMDLKLSSGWAYGPFKCEDCKTHPCLVPYEELPVEQQAKDYLFGAVARHLLAMAG